ncbi:hypothetical protein [Edwardsiella tarda]|uniref:hypothetical protein n=1 Tax=Edwardsiella tarda TaxID=636 RepID=UPI001561C233|nr:hypothetical protein [Edwardsiella tarda]
MNETPVKITSVICNARFKSDELVNDYLITLSDGREYWIDELPDEFRAMSDSKFGDTF